MIALNDTSIYIGEIKQILHTFNLPSCPVHVSNVSKNLFWTLFIDNKNRFVYFDSNSIRHETGDYIYGKYYKNITDTLDIKNMIYDRETHRYLGRYLRFLRDYNDLDLMSMYNCFDSELIKNDYECKTDELAVKFSASDKNYYTYEIPINSKSLTIKLNTHAIVEIALVKSYIKNDNDGKIGTKIKDEIVEKSYRKIKFENPLFYDIKDEWINDAQQFFMLIKVPKSYNKSIVVLEGRYTDKNTQVINEKIQGQINDTPYLVTHEYLVYSQLLTNENITKNYLLGDRLIEFLTDNATNCTSKFYDIARLQLALTNVANIYNELTKGIGSKINYHYGIWNDYDKKLLKGLIIKTEYYKKMDCVCALNKDLESYLQQYGLDDSSGITTIQ